VSAKDVFILHTYHRQHKVAPIEKRIEKITSSVLRPLPSSVINLSEFIVARLAVDPEARDDQVG
jgi:hypothetical protein